MKNSGEIVIIRYYDDQNDLVKVKIKDFLALLAKSEQKDYIADLIFNRLHSRYIKPFKYESDNIIEIDDREVDEYSLYYKSGFSLMANSCLLIETLESFYRGWPNSNKKSELAFLKFFTRENRFKDFSTDDLPTLFYKNIRCGILHQGETTGGWTITRNPACELLDKDAKIINATKFLNRLEKALETYRDELKHSDWNSQIWGNLRKKMKAIIKNCD